MSEALIFFLTATTILFAVLYFQQRDRANDYATDLSSLITRGDIDSRDLRRSLRHKEIREAFDRSYSQDGTLEFIDEYREET